MLDDESSEDMVRRLRDGGKGVPVIALGRWEESRERGKALGASDGLPALPGFPELRTAVLRTLTQPEAVK